MMEFWVIYYNFNANKIEPYNVLAYMEDDIKKLKKRCVTKEEFAEQLKRELRYGYWSKSEYELIISITDNNRVILSPWIGRGNCNEPTVDVTDVTDFDWKAFAEQHIAAQIFKNEAKIDIWDQIEFKWKNFVDYCWYYRHKYQRNDPKFNIEEKK